MAITAKDVKSLREMTGAGMMACKNALTETEGDLEKAVDFLRAKGLAAAQKKASRIAAEGGVATLVEGQLGVIVEVNCETDFVSKGDQFQSFMNSMANHIAKNQPSSVEEMLTQKYSAEQTVSEAVSEQTLKCGEKVDIRRFNIVNLKGEGNITAYNHGGKIGVLVETTTSKNVNDKEEFSELVKDLAMHVAASSPKFMNSSDIDQDFKDREAAIYKEQLLEQGKPEAMIDKIIIGKLNKLASEVCFLEQKFVKDPDFSIKKLIAEVGKKVDAEISINSFYQMNLGEGIEKKEDNLADEVAKMTSGSN